MLYFAAQTESQFGAIETKFTLVFKHCHSKSLLQFSKHVVAESP